MGETAEAAAMEHEEEEALRKGALAEVTVGEG